MNYTIEENIDFYSELNKEDNNETDNKCMLTDQPLSDNYITLPCNHKFNYIPLYHEVSNKLVFNSYDSDKLHNNEIKCPYCRKKYDKLLPYIKVDGIKKINGVNWPEKDCMRHMDCSWKYKCGKNKGDPCSKNAYKKGEHVYCSTHWVLFKNKDISKDTNKDTNKDIKTEDVWTNEMESLYNANHIIGLKKILKNNNLSMTGTKKILVRRIINANIILS